MHILAFFGFIIAIIIYFAIGSAIRKNTGAPPPSNRQYNRIHRRARENGTSPAEEYDKWIARNQIPPPDASALAPLVDAAFEIAKTKKWVSVHRLSKTLGITRNQAQVILDMAQANGVLHLRSDNRYYIDREVNPSKLPEI